MTIVSRIALPCALACRRSRCLSQRQGFATEVTRRFCDRQLTYDIVPPVDVAPDLSRLSGVWKGTVKLSPAAARCASRWSSRRCFRTAGSCWRWRGTSRSAAARTSTISSAWARPRTGRTRSRTASCRIDSGTKWNGTTLLLRAEAADRRQAGRDGGSLDDRPPRAAGVCTETTGMEIRAMITHRHDLDGWWVAYAPIVLLSLYFAHAGALLAVAAGGRLPLLPPGQHDRHGRAGPQLVPGSNKDYPRSCCSIRSWTSRNR